MAAIKRYAVTLDPIVPGTDTMLFTAPSGESYELIVDIGVLNELAQDGEMLNALESLDQDTPLSQQMAGIDKIFKLIMWSAWARHPEITEPDVRSWFVTLGHFQRFLEVFMEYFQSVASSNEDELGEAVAQASKTG